MDPKEPWPILRQQAIDSQIRRRGVRDPRVLDAMGAVPRERFVPRDVRESAYADQALPIGHGQTISQPFIVAFMTEQLKVTPACKVLEIGTGSGYQTAILARLAKHVFTLERIARLQEEAAARLAELNVTNVSMLVGDGSVGLEAHAPYDRILATAAAPRVPGQLVDQLRNGGVLVIPVGGRAEQTIVRVVRHGTKVVEKRLLACRFVKLIGREGWEADEHES